MMKRYSPQRKEAVLKKTPPHNRSIPELAHEGVSPRPPDYSWRKVARAAGCLMPDRDNTPEGWTSQEKFAAVMETAALSEAELAEYCRKRDLYRAQVRALRHACEQANDWDSTESRRLKEARKGDEKRIKELECEFLAKKKRRRWRRQRRCWY